MLFATAACNFWFLFWAPTSAPAALTGLLLGLTRHTNHWKNTAFRDFSNIWRGCMFFLLTFALLHLLSADLTTLLCFSTVHIVGSFYLNFLRQDEVNCVGAALTASLCPLSHELIPWDFTVRPKPPHPRARYSGHFWKREVEIYMWVMWGKKNIYICILFEWS